MDRQEWLLKRNCSMTPRQTMKAFFVLCALSFAVGVIFMLLQGTWVVLGYAMVEMSAVALAFLHYARHATDHEYIALTGNCLLVEQLDAGVALQIWLDASRIHVMPPRNGRDMIVLESRGVKVEVGRFLTEKMRRQVAQELRSGLSGCSLA